MKIIDTAKSIKAGKEKVFELRNLDVRREWGIAEDYSKAMWLCLQQDKPSDYIISTGESYTFREFVEKLYSKMGIKISWISKGLDEVGDDSIRKKVYVTVPSKFISPNDAKVLVGDSTKFANATGFSF